MSEALQVLFGPDLLAGLAAAFVRFNLVLSVAILLVIALRGPLRRWQGPSTAYLLWFAPLVAAGLAPVAVLMGGAPDPLATALAARSELLHGLIISWGLGAAAMAASFAALQATFLARLAVGEAGPAVVGFIAPRIVMPADMSAWSEAERELIRAHEREHVGRKDPRALSVLAVLQCLCWFNPLVHLAAGLVRLDQEMACDAAVILRRPGLRALYARTLLKSQMMGRAMPLACHWAAFGRHPLELRIAQLKRDGAGPASGAVHAAGGAIRP